MAPTFDFGAGFGGNSQREPASLIALDRQLEQAHHHFANRDGKLVWVLLTFADRPHAGQFLDALVGFQAPAKRQAAGFLIRLLP